MTGPHVLPHLQLKDPPQMQIIDPDRIRANREVRGISLRRLAKVLDCSHVTIVKYEDGRIKTISEDRAKMLSMILGFDMRLAFSASDPFVMLEARNNSGMVESA